MFQPRATSKSSIPLAIGENDSSMFLKPNTTSKSRAFGGQHGTIGLAGKGKMSLEPWKKPALGDANSKMQKLINLKNYSSKMVPVLEVAEPSSIVAGTGAGNRSQSPVPAPREMKSNEDLKKDVQPPLINMFTKPTKSEKLYSEEAEIFRNHSAREFSEDDLFYQASSDIPVMDPDHAEPRLRQNPIENQAQEETQYDLEYMLVDGEYPEPESFPPRLVSEECEEYFQSVPSPVTRAMLDSIQRGDQEYYSEPDCNFCFASMPVFGYEDSFESPFSPAASENFKWDVDYDSDMESCDELDTGTYDYDKTPTKL